ncbi:DUF3618 domain-containing protein [Streptomyces sp. NPDC047085]|jgi:hypothetical protein|uniref:DUF3618 domain-containing protein n=1 Tax=Streptomyces sp. NPDC047085 TaxID=3155140 RepID=UPI0033E5C15F
MTHRTPHGSGAKGPDELRQQLERTRHRLGDTVSQLMGKTDMSDRALTRAADLRDKAGAMTVQLRESAGHAVHAVQDAGHAVERHTPEPVRSLARSAKRHTGSLLAAGAGAALAAAGVLRRRQHH